MKLKKVVIFGAGGFGREVLDIFEHNNKKEKEWTILGFVDDTRHLWGTKIRGYPVFQQLAIHVYPVVTYVPRIRSLPAQTDGSAFSGSGSNISRGIGCFCIYGKMIILVGEHLIACFVFATTYSQDSVVIIHPMCYFPLACPQTVCAVALHVQMDLPESYLYLDLSLDAGWIIIHA